MEPQPDLQTFDLLSKARALIVDSKHFAIRAFARLTNGTACLVEDPDACCFCAEGAVQRATDGQYGNDFRFIPALRLLMRAANEVLQRRNLTASSQEHAVFYVNDRLGHEATLEMFDLAIAAATPPQPKVVIPKADLGTGSYYNLKTDKCCSMGHYFKALGVDVVECASAYDPTGCVREALGPDPRANWLWSHNKFGTFGVSPDWWDIVRNNDRVVNPQPNYPAITEIFARHGVTVEFI